MAALREIDATSSRQATLRIPAGKWSLLAHEDGSGPSLLVYPSTDTRQQASGGSTLTPVNMAPAVKLLAFHDHVTGRPSRGGGFPDPVMVEVPTDFGGDIDPVTWLTTRLARGGAEPEALCNALACSEGYRLVRFLLAQDVSVSITELGARYGLSTSHFRRMCRTVLGRNLKTELREWRAARSLMACSGKQMNFTHVAADFGYASPAHFSTDIRNIFGKSPTELLRPALPGGYPR